MWRKMNVGGFGRDEWNGSTPLFLLPSFICNKFNFTLSFLWRNCLNLFFAVCSTNEEISSKIYSFFNFENAYFMLKYIFFIKDLIWFNAWNNYLSFFSRNFKFNFFLTFFNDCSSWEREEEREKEKYVTTDRQRWNDWNLTSLKLFNRYFKLIFTLNNLTLSCESFFFSSNL